MPLGGGERYDVVVRWVGVPNPVRQGGRHVFPRCDWPECFARPPLLVIVKRKQFGGRDVTSTCRLCDYHASNLREEISESIHDDTTS